VEVRAVVRAWPRLLEVLTLSVRRAVVVQTCGRMSADVMCRAGNRRAPVVVQAVMGVGRVAGAVLVVAVVGCGSPNSLNQAAGGRSSAPGDASSPTVTTNAPSIPAPPPVCASTLLFPEITSDLIVEDGTFASVASMARAAELIVVGEVVEVVSLGRPDVEEDPNADEYVAVTTDVTEILKGDPISEVVLGWDAFGYDTDGNRVSTLLSNGVRPPQVGDRLLLFLVVADPAFADALGGGSHQEVKLDGVAYLDGDRLIAGELGSRVSRAAGHVAQRDPRPDQRDRAHTDRVIHARAIFEHRHRHEHPTRPSDGGAGAAAVNTIGLVGATARGHPHDRRCADDSQWFLAVRRCPRELRARNALRCANPREVQRAMVAGARRSLCPHGLVPDEWTPDPNTHGEPIVVNLVLNASNDSIVATHLGRNVVYVPGPDLEDWEYCA